MSATDWTPDQPLRSDATDEQVQARWAFLADSCDVFPGPFGAVAREYAAARVDASEAEVARLRAEVKRLRGELLDLCDAWENCSLDMSDIRYAREIAAEEVRDG